MKKIGLLACCLATVLTANTEIYDGFYKDQSIKEIQSKIEIEKDNVILEKNSEIYKKVKTDNNEELYFNFIEDKLKDIYLVKNEKDISEKDISEKDYEFVSGLINERKLQNKQEFIEYFESEKEDLNNEIIKNLNLALLYKNSLGVELTILNRCEIVEVHGSCLQCDFVKNTNIKEIECKKTKLYKTK